MMPLWIYLHFPDLQLNSIYDDQKQGLVIVEGRKNEIVQLNQVASHHGVRRGMGLATAASMCRELKVLEYDAKYESEKLKEIAHWLYVVTADISLYEPNGILLRASNMLTLYDGLENYWQALVVQLGSLPFSYSFASGYSPFAARMLARKHVNTISASTTELLQAIYQCRLSDTELSPKQVAKLNRVGVHRLADLLRIPIAEMTKRFDVELVNYVGLLTGKFHHVVEFYHPPEQFSRYLDLLFEIENLTLLEKPLSKLLTQLEHFLRIRAQYAHELSLTLSLRRSHDYTVNVTSASGAEEPSTWLHLFRLRFESVKLKAPIVRITLMAVRVAPKQGEIADLFEGRQGQVSSLELLSILQAKLGAAAVRGLTVTEDPRPHLSSQFCEPLNQAKTRIDRDKRLLRPSILLPSPKPLRERITLVQGPERFATGWWDGDAMVRDYFIARAANGSWLWVFRTPAQQWFLHGVFS